MVREQVIQLPPGVKDAPLRGLRKKGRPRKSDVGRPPSSLRMSEKQIRHK